MRRQNEKEGSTMERIPLLEEIRAEVVRIAAAAGGEGGSEIFRQLERLETALRFLLAVATFAENKVAYPERLRERLRELGLR
jgi:phage FluMu gp28-like protein